MHKIKVLFIAVGDVYGSGKALLKILEAGLRNKTILPFVVLGSDMGLKEKLMHLDIPYKIIPYKFDIYPEIKTIKDLILFFPRIVKIYYLNNRAAKSIKDIAYARKIDIIHTNTGVYRFGQKVSEMLKIPHVWHIREYQDLGMGYKFIGGKRTFCKLLNKSNNYPVTITTGLLKYFNLGVNARVIYDGVRFLDTQIFSHEKEDYFLFVGNICEHKGVAELINAFVVFAKYDNDFKLYIVGKNEGNYSNFLNEIVIENNLTDRILFLGFRNDIDELMAKATALIVASTWEGFGLITAEAMFNGCLVIGKNTAGTKEQFDNGYKIFNSEIAIRYNEFDDLVDAMKTIVEKGIEHYFPMILNAQKAAASLYSVEKNSQEIVELYREILLNPKIKDN